MAIVVDASDQLCTLRIVVIIAILMVLLHRKLNDFIFHLICLTCNVSVVVVWYLSSKASTARVKGPGFNPQPRHHFFSFEWWLSGTMYQGSIS